MTSFFNHNTLASERVRANDQRDLWPRDPNRPNRITIADSPVLVEVIGEIADFADGAVDTMFSMNPGYVAVVDDQQSFQLKTIAGSNYEANNQTGYMIDINSAFWYLTNAVRSYTHSS